MNARTLLLSSLIALLPAACATVPPGPPPDVVRLQADLDRLHHDPRIMENAGPELGNADAAVDTLARNARELDADELHQGVYVADKLVQIAEASALARYAEHRGMELGAERERLLADVDARAPRTVVTTTEIERRPVPRGPTENAELMAIQSQLYGFESRVDDRGLVVRLGEFQFEPNQAMLTPSAQASLDSLARVLAAHPDATLVVEGYGMPRDGALAVDRARAVQDYLDARGIDVARIQIRDTPIVARADTDRRVELVIRK